MKIQNFKYTTVPTQFITAVNGIKFAYQQNGRKERHPNHFV